MTFALIIAIVFGIVCFLGRVNKDAKGAQYVKEHRTNSDLQNSLKLKLERELINEYLDIAKSDENHKANDWFMNSNEKRVERCLSRFEFRTIPAPENYRTTFPFLCVRDPIYFSGTISNYASPEELLCLSVSLIFGIPVEDNTFMHEVYSKNLLNKIPNQETSELKEWIKEHKLNFGDDNLKGLICFALYLRDGCLRTERSMSYACQHTLNKLADKHGLPTSRYVSCGLPDGFVSGRAFYDYTMTNGNLEYPNKVWYINLEAVVENLVKRSMVNSGYAYSEDYKFGLPLLDEAPNKPPEGDAIAKTNPWIKNDPTWKDK
jgi:hypothetical protein